MIEHNTSAGPGGSKAFGACLRTRHTGGRFFLKTIFSFSDAGLSEGQEQLVTILDAENMAATVNGRRTFNRIPGNAATYHQSLTLEELLVLHEHKLSQLDKTPMLIRTQDELIHHVDALARRYFDHMLKRGVFIEVGE